MKRKVIIIGIGAGNPDFVTIQAIDAMNRVDVFFIPDKGIEKADLSRVRRLIIDRYVRDRSVRTVEYRVPSRRQESDSYEGTVTAWHADVGKIYGRLILEEAGRIGDRRLSGLGRSDFSMTARCEILEHLRTEGDFELDYDVIPGISSLQALAAQHRTAINEIGRSVLITNGRLLAEGFPNNVDSVMVLLNADKALRSADGELDAYWGAYIGMPEEVLVSGKLKDIVDDIERIRSAARQENGWIMDCLLLKKPPSPR